MSDIKALTFREDNFNSRAHYYSQKYNIPIKHAKIEEPYIEIAKESKLHAKNDFITNLFHKNQFSKRVSNYQRENHLKKVMEF